ncbi:hypothetical protein [Dyadobacter sp. CY347]|uniref:hypothetical protein n=1 Tax=Dyadobacter sp. CY347 TaxID=2909336 RepID=UPI001F246BFE|nr:hypothetical protein [Dyadobacter sp. CY347]MCF2489928.1 hypothetical protein [Dyadobacter sp. CY347]
MDSYNKKNLTSLLAEFHDKGEAKKGILNLINNYFLNDNQSGLAHLLRFHRPVPVDGSELKLRYQVDALLDCYGILAIAIFSGYIPNKLDKELTDEILLVLDNQAIKEYYTIHYPNPIVFYLCQYVKENRTFQQEANTDTIGAFTEFVSLFRFLKQDKDICRFMEMLDFVWYDGETISEVTRILSSFEELNKAFTSRDSSPATRSVKGFIKYTAFLSQLRTLIEATVQYPILQSSLWTFHSYYFDQIDLKMADLLDRSFSNIEQAFRSPQLFAKIADGLVIDKNTSLLDESKLSLFASLAIHQAREDADFVLDKKWGDALIKYFSS